MSGPSEEAALEVHKWFFDGSGEHAAGLQSAVVGDVIHDEHVGYANFISIVGQNPRQMRVVLRETQHLRETCAHMHVHIYMCTYTYAHTHVHSGRI